MGASCRTEEERNGRIKGNLFGGEGVVRSIYKKGDGVGIGRCILRGGGSVPFLIKWINWFNVVIHINSIAISIHIPVPVATLGWYFSTWVWHSISRPPPNPCVKQWKGSVCGVLKTVPLIRPYARLQWMVKNCIVLAVGWHGGKLPDERRRCRPKLCIIRQGLHPHPGPIGHGCGFDDSQESD